MAAEARARRTVIVVPNTLRPEFMTAVQSVSTSLELVPIASDEENPPAAASDAQILYRASSFRPAVIDAILDRATDLRWMHVPAAGVDFALSPRVLAGDFVITHMADVYDAPVSEFTLGLMLAAAKKLPTFLEGQHEKKWLRPTSWEQLESQHVVPQLLQGKTLGLVGFGGIGQALAKSAVALGMRVIAYRRSAQPDPLAEEVYGPGQLSNLLSQSDYVVLTLPLTKDTEGTIGAAELASMRPSAWLINVARGRLVDEAALVRSLESGQIAGAALDVFLREPLPQDHPLYRLPNVILTPHVAGAFAGVNQKELEVFTELLRLFLEGKPLKFLVDRRRGY